MRFESPRFGEIEVDDQLLIRFDSGLPGFPDCTSFVVMEHDKETPLKWLQCVERPEVAFLIVEPELIGANYDIDLNEVVLARLDWNRDLDEPHDVSVFVILNVDGGALMANLRAPVAVHLKQRRACQLILDDPDVPLRYRVEPEKDSEPPA